MEPHTGRPARDGTRGRGRGRGRGAADPHAPRGNKGRVLGYYVWITTGEQDPYYNLVQRDWMVLLDYYAHVERATSMTYTVTYQLDGRTYAYKPSLEAWVSGRRVLVDCTAQRQADCPETQRHYDAIRSVCGRSGCDFEVVTGAGLRAGCLFVNVSLCAHFARDRVSPELEASVYGALGEAQPPATLGELADRLSPGNNQAVMPGILAMIWYGKLRAPMRDWALSGDSPVSLPGPVSASTTLLRLGLDAAADDDDQADQPGDLPKSQQSGEGPISPPILDRQRREGQKAPGQEGRVDGSSKGVWR